MGRRGGSAEANIIMRSGVDLHHRASSRTRATIVIKAGGIPDRGGAATLVVRDEDDRIEQHVAIVRLKISVVCARARRRCDVFLTLEKSGRRAALVRLLDARGCRFAGSRRETVSAHRRTTKPHATHGRVTVLCKFT
jgi:hypothetical protein